MLIFAPLCTGKEEDGREGEERGRWVSGWGGGGEKEGGRGESIVGIGNSFIKGKWGEN